MDKEAQDDEGECFTPNVAGRLRGHHVRLVYGGRLVRFERGFALATLGGLIVVGEVAERAIFHKSRPKSLYENRVLSSVPNRGIEKSPKLSAARRVTQFAQRLRFNLPDALTRDSKTLSHFLERMLAAIVQAKTHLNNFFFARRQGLQHRFGLFLQVDVDDGFGG